MSTGILPYQNSTKKIIVWQSTLNHKTKVMLAFFFSCLTGLFAQLRIQLPFSPVPITLQTIAVLGSGVVLGPVYGCISQVLYVSLGVVGVNWFAGKAGGIETIMGPTGGYLIGFVLAAFFSGFLQGKLLSEKNSFWKVTAGLLIINCLLIYGFGLVQLYLWYKLALGQMLTIKALILKGALPFLGGDLLKIGCLTLYMNY